MEAMAGYWRWVNSAQQLADGLTKPSARDNFVIQLKRGVHQLKYDPSYTAAKKVTKDDKEKELAEHEEAAKKLFGQEILFEEEEMKKPCQCRLPGCENDVAILHGKKTKYCSRHHYYKHLHHSEPMKRCGRKQPRSLCPLWFSLQCQAPKLQRSQKPIQPTGPSSTQWQ